MNRCYVKRAGETANLIKEIRYGSRRVIKIVKNGTLIWGIGYQGLSFTCSTANSKVSLSKVGEPNSALILYSTDGDTWSNYEFDTEVTLQNVGDVVLFRAGDGGNSSFSVDTDNRYGFVITGRVSCSGHVKYLLSVNGTTNSIPDNAFVGLFDGCTGMTSMPSLDITTIGASAYKNMFKGCTGLSTVGTISVSTLSANCFEGMFEGCTGITSVSPLEHVQLAEYCYKRMFAGCTGITSIPSLNVTNLSVGCYEGMFEGCTGIVSVPALPATTLTDGCYVNMFNGCSNLKAITTNQVSFVGCDDWVGGVSASGVFTCAQILGTDATIQRGDSACPTYWYVPTESTSSPISIRAGKDGCVVAIAKYGSPYTTKLYYSVDGGIWEDYTVGNQIRLTGGASVSFRSQAGSSCRFSKSVSDYYKFSIDGVCYASGNVMSLISPGLDSVTVPAYAFANLFNGCTALLSAPSTPATSLNEGCYFSMFNGCTNLSKSPSLPSLTAPSMCYTSMFKGCSALATVSDLPATSLGVHCYGWMFEGCIALSRAPKLSAVSTTPNCYNYMFNGCSNLTYIETNQLDFDGTSFWAQGVRNTGTFKCSASLGTQSTIQRGVSACPNGWTVVNI